MKKQRFYKRSVFGLMRFCLDEIRAQARSCPTLMSRKGGAIRFDFCPGTGATGDGFREWFEFYGDSPYVPEAFQYVYRFSPDWDYKIWCEEGKEHGPVDCPSYAEMKAASCSLRLAEGIGFESGPLPASSGAVFETADEWGFAEHKGAIVYVIVRKGHWDEVVGEIYVSISGGTQDEDEMLAKCTAPIINDYFRGDEEVEILPASTHLS